LEHHFQILARTPAEVLRHIGSPFAPDRKTPCLITRIPGSRLARCSFLLSPDSKS
jgi:hypothetical protein